jgi:hypothetical protein
MTLAQVTDHAEQAPELLLEQYREKPRIKALLLSYVRRCQELDDAVWDVIVKRLIDDAENAQLDAIGRIVGEERDGKPDATYRIYIAARIRINRSHGHPGDVIDVIRLIEASAFRYLEYFPASADIEFTEPPLAAPGHLLAIAQQARSAGVRLGLVASILADANSIIGSTEEGELSNLQGGADDAETVGGVGANAYE